MDNWQSAADPERPGPHTATAVPPRSPDSLSVTAYERIEELIVHCELAPGADVRMQDLQTLIGIGRTPVHQAVRRLAAETLIRIRPRDGLQISPIDLGRDRRLLQLRRDMDRFSVRLAAEKLDANHRNRLLRLGRLMRERARLMDVHEFNGYDRELDTIILSAADEPFLDRTLRPLHTIFRRTGHLFLSHVGDGDGLAQTIACHLDLLDAVEGRDPERASKASDTLIAYADSMFVRLETAIEPHLLDASLR